MANTGKSSKNETPRVFKVIPTTQLYDWGKKGRSAKVAQFAEKSGVPGFVVDENKSYAEVGLRWVHRS